MIIPTIIEKKDNKEIAYDLYSRLLEERIIFVSGEITNEKANLIISELLYLDSLSHEDICIYINSPGGDISAGMAIIDTMDYVISDIKTIVVGLAASMAAIILANGSPKKRMSLKSSEIMIHQPLGGVHGQATEINIAAERIIKIKYKINRLLAKLTKKSIKKINNDTERDFFMDAKEALEYNIIDKII